MVCREVLRYWKGMDGDALEAYMGDNFDKNWHVIDATNKESLDVRNAYSFVRSFAGEDQRNYSK